MIIKWNYNTQVHIRTHAAPSLDSILFSSELLSRNYISIASLLCVNYLLLSVTSKKLSLACAVIIIHWIGSFQHVDNVFFLYYLLLLTNATLVEFHISFNSVCIFFVCHIGNKHTEIRWTTIRWQMLAKSGDMRLPRIMLLEYCSFIASWARQHKVKGVKHICRLCGTARTPWKKEITTWRFSDVRATVRKQEGQDDDDVAWRKKGV